MATFARMGTSEFDRRRFLQGAAATGGALLGAGGLLGACSSSPSNATKVATTVRSVRTKPTALLDVPASSSPITHVVVLMQENRSFDHWLGWLSQDEKFLESGKRRFGKKFNVTGDLQQTFSGANGNVSTQHLTSSKVQTNPFRGCGFEDPGHSWKDGRAERDHGFLAPQSGNDAFALGYYKAADLPFSSLLAARFTVCDHSFASLLGPTFPNRMYMHSAQSGGRKNNDIPTTPFDWDTIWDRLASAGVSTGYFYSDLPVTFLWGDRNKAITTKIDDYFAACNAGTLPQVCFVDPSFIGAMRTDNHPLGDIHAGERFARDVFAAFAQSKHWEHGLFVSTYDEWGGFFDHVKPPILADDRASHIDDENFGQAGFRVPTLVASPYAQQGFVDHNVYDHTSILRFLEWRFLGAPATGTGGSKDWSLTKRDRHANNIGLSLVEEPNKNIGIDLDVKIPAPSPGCDNASYDGISAPVKPTTSIEQAYEAGEFDRLGITVEQTQMAHQWAGVHAV